MSLLGFCLVDCLPGLKGGLLAKEVICVADEWTTLHAMCIKTHETKILVDKILPWPAIVIPIILLYSIIDAAV